MPMDNFGVELELENVRISDSFWSNRIDAVKTGALPAMYDQMKKTGRWDCLKLDWKPGMPNKPHRFWDSDVAKWLEAACYTLIHEPDPSLASLVEEAVDLIRGAQQDDGYINTYYTVVEPGNRWTNIAWSHEMYDAGHLLEAALAHRIYSGSNRLLDPILKYVKHIRSVFGLQPGQKAGYPGHQELELALLKTYDYLVVLPSESGDFDVSILLELADYFLEERGRIRSEGHYFDVEAHARGEEEANAGPAPMGEPRFSYYQADRVIREMKDVNGHSVRVMYWLTAVAHLARLKKDESLLHAAETLWTSTTERKMYLSGGLGAIGDWEGFGEDYYLPNESGYVETCAAIGLVLFARQMLLLNPRKAKYAHVMERALYNGVLVGMSLDGKSFFYENPLATVGKKRRRSDWFEVSCCPPNVARLLGSLNKYIYTYAPEDNTLHVHLYISSESKTVLPSGSQVTVVQKRKGPWDGQVEFKVHGVGTSGIKLALRKPEWAANFEIFSSTYSYVVTTDTSSEIVTLSVPAGLASFSFTVTFSLVIRKVQPHPLNLDNYRHLAFAYGPFIYCAESIDNPHVSDLRSIRLFADAPVHEVYDYQKFARWGLNDVKLLRMTGKVVGDNGRSGTARDADVILVPLFTWANRGQSDLRVWLPLE